VNACRLTRREKDAIRAMPCGKCGAIPPFADGSRCHPHRIEPALGYVAGNVVPRCPPCHSEEPGHKPWVKHALAAGRRVHDLHPDLARENARALNTSLTPTERSASARKAARRMHELHPDLARANGRRTHELHPDLARESGRRSHELHPDRARENARATNARLTTAQRSAATRKGWAARRARQEAA